MTKAQMTAADYLGLLRGGFNAEDAVIALANRYGVRRGAVRSRLQRAKLLAPYKSRRQSVHPQNVGAIPGDEIMARRVDRDPCQRCGTRGDLVCGHRRVSGLTGVVFA